MTLDCFIDLTVMFTIWIVIYYVVCVFVSGSFAKNN